MVAVIKTGSSLQRALNYNEQKVKAGVAECILVANYPKDVELLTLSNKLNRLLNQAALNENVTRNSIHISLNFDPSENLSHDQLREIAGIYMQKIGFGDQPYLVYQHHDAGHPHLHLVTVKVRADGSRIDTQNIGRNQSEKARKEIEQSFRLVKAEDCKNRQDYELKPAAIQKVQYGRSATKKAITNVLEAVLKSYRYTSLPELNAVLKLYNVTADGGSEHSRVQQHQGLTYRVLDEQGNKIGVPIKASDFYNNPTLKYLEERFQQNESARQPQKARVKNAIDLALWKQPNHSLTSLIKALEKEGIATVLRINMTEVVYGITYVDHQTKCVFNGSALGKPYSAHGIQQRCASEELFLPQQIAQQSEKVQLSPSTTESLEQPSSPKPGIDRGISNNQSTASKLALNSVLEALLQPERNADYVPYQLKDSGKKKKRKRINNNL